MSYLLDTNVISEPQRPAPDANVLKWFSAVDFDELYISALTIGEIKKGTAKLADGRRKVQLQNWLEELRAKFSGRILALSEETFIEWGIMVAGFEKKGVVRPPYDALIEATAIEHDLILVTRNVKNFQDSTVTILNPWD